MLPPHPLDVEKVCWSRARGNPIVIGVAIAEDRPQAGVLQPADCLIGMVRRVIIVRPVVESSDARIERLERAQVVCDVHIAWSVQATHDAANAGEILRKSPVDSSPTQQ